MSFVLLEILIPLIIAFLLGLLFGWFMWGWRRTKISYTEWETMRQKANRSSSVEAEGELAELRADRDRLQGEIDSHVCEVATADTGGADLGTGVLGLSGAAAVAAATEGESDAEVAPDGADGTDGESSNASSDDEASDAEAGDGDVHPYGEGSHAPLSDPKAQPEGYDIKGNADSMLYHRTDSRSYKVTIAEVWFDTAERAEAAGFGLANSHPKD